MGESKYPTHVQPRLKEIEAWVRDGANEHEIAKKLGVCYSAFQNYKHKHKDLVDTLKKTKDYVDLVEVVGAYKKRAVGYDTTEYKRVYKWLPDPDTGELVKTLVEEQEIVKHVPGDARAMEHWLALRQRAIWTEAGNQVDDAGGGIVIMPARMELQEPIDAEYKEADENE